MRSNRSLFAVLMLLAGLMGCGGGDTAKAPAGSVAGGGSSLGVGPIKASLNIPSTIDPALAAKGKTTFEAKCTACHKLETRYVGPALAGVSKRRQPEWIMNMVMNPSEMTQKDPVAQGLLAEYAAQMADQHVTQDEARAIVEYFRQQDAAAK